MKIRWVTATCITALFAFAGTAVVPQDRAPERAPGRNDQKLSENRTPQNHAKLDDHGRQVIRDWYKPDQDKILIGLRDPNGAAPYVDSRLQIGFALDADLSTRRMAPVKIWHRLTSFSRNYQYVAIQGHVEAIDDNYQDMNDLIHLKLYF